MLAVSADPAALNTRNGTTGTSLQLGCVIRFTAWVQYSAI
jgi:hypothetical protein